jgi:uncharacterized protein YbjT (DUF2867 family)
MASTWQMPVPALDKAFPMDAAEDVGRIAAELLLEKWTRHRVVELEGPRSSSPNDLAEAFPKSLGGPVEASIVARDSWDGLFRAQGVQNPIPRIQMLDGFNDGWIDFPQRDGRSARAR